MTYTTIQAMQRQRDSNRAASVERGRSLLGLSPQLEKDDPKMVKRWGVSSLDEQQKVKSSLDSQSKCLFGMLKGSQGMQLHEVFASVSGSFDAYYKMVCDALCLNPPDSLGQHNWTDVETLIGAFPEKVLLRCSKSVNGESIRVYYLCDVRLVSTDDGFQVEFGACEEVEIQAHLQIKEPEKEVYEISRFVNSHKHHLEREIALYETAELEKKRENLRETSMQRIKDIKASGINVNENTLLKFDKDLSDISGLDLTGIMNSEKYKTAAHELTTQLVAMGYSESDVTKALESLAVGIAKKHKELEATVDGNSVSGVAPVAAKAGIPNANSDLIPHDVMKSAVAALQNRCEKTGGVPMFLDHPEEEDLTKVAGFLNKVSLSDLGDVSIQFDFCETEQAKSILAMMAQGVNIGVSLRGSSNNIKREIFEGYGVASKEVKVATALKIDAFDFVINPASEAALVYLT